MDDLISRAAAIEAFDDERVDRNYGDVSPESVIEVIKSIPAVEAAPVVHGRWEENGNCSVCEFQPWYEHDIHTLSYCPNCGAKMDGE